MKKFTFIFLFFLTLNQFFQSTVYSQTEDTQKQWTTAESPGAGLTFSVPADFLIDNEVKNAYQIIAFSNRDTMRVEVEMTGEGQKRIKQFKFTSSDKNKVTRFEVDNFLGVVNTFEKEGNFEMSIYAASPSEYYRIYITSEDLNNAAVLKFARSIKLGNKPLLKNQNLTVQSGENKISIDSLKTSPAVLEALKRKDAKKTKMEYDLKNEKDLRAEIAKDSKNHTRPIFILRKPRPSYTDSGRQNQITGIIRLKVLFRADGEVDDIVILKKLGSGLDEEAAEAVRKIKFLPAEIEEKPVDAVRILEYSFSIY